MNVIKLREKISLIIESLNKDYDVKNAELEIKLDNNSKLKIILK